MEDLVKAVQNAIIEYDDLEKTGYDMPLQLILIFKDLEKALKEELANGTK